MNEAKEASGFVQCKFLVFVLNFLFIPSCSCFVHLKFMINWEEIETCPVFFPVNFNSRQRCDPFLFLLIKKNELKRRGEKPEFCFNHWNKGNSFWSSVAILSTEFVEIVLLSPKLLLVPHCCIFFQFLPLMQTVWTWENEEQISCNRHRITIDSDSHFPLSVNIIQSWPFGHPIH